MRLTTREKQLILHAFKIALEDGSILPTGDTPEDDDRLRDERVREIDEIIHKLSASWNRTP